MTQWAPLYRSRPSSRWTYGDIAAKVGADLGIAPDDEQRALLDMIYAEKAPGRPAAFEVLVIGPRQNIKTSTLGVAALADLFVFGVEKHLWSAHLDDTAGKTFADFKTWINTNPEYSEQVRFYEGHQDRAIVHVESGRRIDFGSRTGKANRGLTGVERVTLDEALYLEPQHIGAIYPTMLTRPGSQVRLASSAGLKGSAVLRGKRDQGRTGTDRRMAYVEYGAPRRPCSDEKCLHAPDTEGCALDDRELWWWANCALWCGRIGEDALENMRASMPPEEFMREFLSWWEDPLSLGGAFDPERWDSLADFDMLQPEHVPAIGLAGSLDGRYGSIGAASELQGGRLAVAPVDRRRGQQWLVAEAARIQEAHGCAVVIDRRGPLAYLIPDLRDAGVSLTELDASDWVDACASLWRRVEDSEVAHPGDPQLTAAVLGAGWRPVGERRAFGRKGADISLLEAVTLAASALGDDYDVMDSIG